MSASTPSDDLQFSTAESTTMASGHGVAAAVACAECTRPIADYYFTVGELTLCASCKARLERTLAGEDTSRAGRIAKALVYGSGAALAGAAIWYAVAAMFGIQHAIIAIFIGWMVGRAVNAGSGGRGGRRYQVAAALLTYISVAMSYAAFRYRAFDNGFDLGRIAALFAFPVVANLSRLPWGLIGLAIIAFGVHRAWEMNAPAVVTITGPHRIGAAPEPAPSL